MSKYDLKNNIAVAVAVAITAVTGNGTTTGNIIDLQGYEGATFLIHSGTITDATYTPILKESETGSFSGEETAVADDDLIGTEAAAVFLAADDNVVKTLGYRGQKRYVRLEIAVTDETTGGTIGALVVKSHPHVAAVA